EPPKQAARLLGAAAGLRGTELLGDLDVTRTRAAVRAELSPATYEKAFDQGKHLRSAAVSER
ncbi:hypothetical protein P8605_44035, partial [Streptomyces sp. T-3]|nr:hypothetical protein [Streptomyces sp. T-3]